jgi:hypothetical protein
MSKDTHLATKLDIAQLETSLMWRVTVMLVAQVGIVLARAMLP